MTPCSIARTVLFPGSFDPFTVGHADLVERALCLFDKVIIGVGYNEQKRGLIPAAERIKVLHTYYETNARVEVKGFSCLTTDFARSCGTVAILRGVRSLKDYDYELAMADTNRMLSPELETVVLLARPEFVSCSSSVVRELLHFGHSIAEWLPQGLHYPSLESAASLCETQ